MRGEECFFVCSKVSDMLRTILNSVSWRLKGVLGIIVVVSTLVSYLILCLMARLDSMYLPSSWNHGNYTGFQRVSAGYSHVFFTGGNHKSFTAPKNPGLLVVSSSMTQRMVHHCFGLGALEFEVFFPKIIAAFDDMIHPILNQQGIWNSSLSRDNWGVPLTVYPWYLLCSLGILWIT